MERLRSKRRMEATLQHNRLRAKHSHGDISKDIPAYCQRTKKTPDKLFPPVQITVAQSWDDVTSCGKRPQKRSSTSDRLLSPSDLPFMSRSKSQGDVTESIKAFHGSNGLLSPTLLSPTSPVHNSSFGNSHYLAAGGSSGELTRSVSDNDVRSDKVKLLKHRKRTGSWNCLKSPNTSSSDNSPERECVPIPCPVYDSRKPSKSVDTFGRRAGEKGLRAWLGLASKRSMSPQRKGHR